MGLDITSFQLMDIAEVKECYCKVRDINVKTNQSGKSYGKVAIILTLSFSLGTV